MLTKSITFTGIAETREGTGYGDAFYVGGARVVIEVQKWLDSLGICPYYQMQDNDRFELQLIITPEAGISKYFVGKFIVIEEGDSTYDGWNREPWDSITIDNESVNLHDIEGGVSIEVTLDYGNDVFAKYVAQREKRQREIDNGVGLCYTE